MLNIRERKQEKGYPKRIPLFYLSGKQYNAILNMNLTRKVRQVQKNSRDLSVYADMCCRELGQNGEKKMTREEFEQLAGAGVILLDGATGSNLTKAGMPKGVSTELWVLEHPDILANLQKAYVEAGSQIVYAPTFGANRLKLADYGRENEVEELNARLVDISKKALAGTVR